MITALYLVERKFILQTSNKSIWLVILLRTAILVRVLPITSKKRVDCFLSINYQWANVYLGGAPPVLQTEKRAVRDPRNAPFARNLICP